SPSRAQGVVGAWGSCPLVDCLYRSTMPPSRNQLRYDRAGPTRFRYAAGQCVTCTLVNVSSNTKGGASSRNSGCSPANSRDAAAGLSVRQLGSPLGASGNDSMIPSVATIYDPTLTNGA